MEENKKWVHKETERQRRQEMANLCTTLRSLLPLEYIKGKRSTADHVCEAMKYINDLQNKVKQLRAKKDELLKISNFSTSSPECSSSTSSTIQPFVMVQPFPGGLEIMCSYSFNMYCVFPFSRVLDILLKEGINVVSSTSNKIDGRFIHTIRSEKELIHPEMFATDYFELQRKLTEAIASSSLQETLCEPDNR